MLFYFFNNKGILKYLPITGDYTGEISTNRHKSLEMTLKVYQKSLDQLEEYMHSQNPHSFHSIYMKLKLRYKINDISNLLGRGHIYRTPNMLKDLDTIIREHPDFIRASYLKGHICAADGQHLREAELYYKQAVYSMHNLYPNDAEESFLWYQLGRYYEKKRKDLDKAEICYTESYNRDTKWFRVLFKMALIKKRHHKEIETIDLCNQIIAAILNGYEGFNEVLSACMPKQPVYRQLIYCAMGMADNGSAEEYNLQMKKS